MFSERIHPVQRQSMETFARKLSEWLRDHEGEYVVIRGLRVLGFAKTLHAANMMVLEQKARPVFIGRIRRPVGPSESGIVTPAGLAQ